MNAAIGRLPIGTDILDSADESASEQNTHFVVKAESTFPRELVDRYYADQLKVETFQKRNLRVQRLLCAATIGAFLAAGIYADIAYRQWGTMERQLTATDRPWIYADVEPIGTMHVTQDRVFINIRFFLRNVGHSPASLLTTTGSTSSQQERWRMSSLVTAVTAVKTLVDQAFERLVIPR